MITANSLPNQTDEKLPWLIRLKLWNRRRIHMSRIRRLRRTDPAHRSSVPRPQTVTSLLFIEAQEGWGDFLYCLGLIKALTENGVEVDVVSLPETFERYKAIPFVRNVFSMADEADKQVIGRTDYDIAIDVTYVNAIHWDLRAPILSMLRCHTMTIGDVTAHSKLFDEYVNVGVRCHWKDRNVLLLNAILGRNAASEPILPFYLHPESTPTADAFKESLNHKEIVYVNCIARVEERSLSDGQVEALIDLFNRRKQAIGIFCVRAGFPVKETPWVIRLPKMPFEDFTEVVRCCKAVITPDTSVVHLGSIFRLPTFGIYCGNNRDYWPQYAMQDVWAPLAEGSVAFFEDDPNTSCASDFVYRHPKKPVSCYSPMLLAERVEDFLEKLGLFQTKRKFAGRS